MTREEYKNLLIKISSEGGFPSVLPAEREYQLPSCMYRHPNGRKCVVGHIIPDADYIPTMENTTVAGLVQKYNLDLSKYVSGVTMAELSELQLCHDTLADKESWDHQKFVEEISSILN